MVDALDSNSSSLGLMSAFKPSDPSGWHFSWDGVKSLGVFLRIQRRALRVIFPDCSYSEGLTKAGLTTLYDRRSMLCKELFSDIDTQGNHKLSHLLSVRSQQNYALRLTHAFAAPVCKTDRFRDSFIISHCT